MKSARFLGAWLVLIGACTPTSTPVVPTRGAPSASVSAALPAPPPPLAAPWEALSAGDFERARSGFAAAQSETTHAQEALAGLIIVAAATSDSDAARSLIDSVAPETASALLAVSAAEAAIALRPFPPKTLAIISRVCSLQPAEDLADRAREVCAFKPIAGLGRTLDRCTGACADETTFPLYFAAAQPVVLASINGSEPAPFIVDTGASTSVITTSFAAKAGIQPLPGTEFGAHAAGGVAKASRAVVTIKAGAVVVEDVAVAIIDLPIDQLGGIIAPQSTWRSLAVDFDFRGFSMKLSPRFQGDSAMVSLPYLQHGERPMLMMETEGRPARPIVIDTGAYSTVLETRWDALGTPLARGEETRMAGAGGTGARAWRTKVDLAAKSGELQWTLHEPTLTEGELQDAYPVRSVGLLGMDLMMGRRFVVDVPRRQVWISKQASLAQWAIGATTTYRVTLQRSGKPLLVTEKVVERTEDLVTLEVSYKHPKGEKHFRFQMKDTWQSRGKWFSLRPVSKAWELKGKLATEVARKDIAQLWKPLMPDFKTTRPTSNPKISFELIEIAGKKTSCTTLVLPAEVSGAAAELSMTDCPSDPWRTKRISLKTTDGKGVWLVER